MYGLIDYTITVTIDKPNWVERVKNSALLVIHTIFIPLQSSNPLKRYFPLSLHNLAGEVWLDKHKTCMVWDIQTLSIMVLQPKEK